MGNGCGPAWLPSWIKSLLFDWFFEASCDKHDIGYTKGGDEIRRFECDWKFWLAMKKDTLRYSGLKRLIRWVQAILYFTLVRLFGWKFFNYT
mgnify:FL=1|tara:strand:- start:3939 stop:4214 length:276 start_codon:yes stop_codon:yes gene_type:complete